MTEEGPPPPKRVKLSRLEIENLSREELMEKWYERETFVEAMMSKQSNHLGEASEAEICGLRESEEKLKQKQIEATRRENVLMMRLTTKEQEMQEYMNQIAELKQAQNTSTAQLRSMLLDPAINLMFQRMKKEMEACKEKLEQAQNDLAAWKFTPDSQTGKRLMAKCRMLLQENEELGKIISSGRTAKLEGEIALEKTLVGEMKKSQAEMDEFLVELDEDVEGMQSTIYFLQQQLKDSKEQVSRLQQENEELRTKCRTPIPPSNNTSATVASVPQTSTSETAQAEETHPRTGTDKTPTLGLSTPPPSSSSQYEHRTELHSPHDQPPSQGGGVPLVSNYSSLISQNHITDPAMAAATTHSSSNNNNKSHLSQASNSSAPNGAHRTVDQSGNNTETDLSDEVAESGDEEVEHSDAPLSPTLTPAQYVGLEKDHQNGPPVSGGKYPPSDGAYGTENTDATSSDGWSPTGSKHSGSVGNGDGDASSEVSDTDPGTDTKGGELIQNGLVTTPQYDSQGDDDET